jgi:hypothetical protein
MDDLPRQKLAELIRRFGREIAGDARRCEALLKDACPQHKREIFVLVSAAKESVGVELLGSSSGAPKEALVSRLTMRVHENLGLPESLARWAVESWALALGLASATDFRFPFKCPGCGAAGTMPTGLAGHKVTCPRCKAVLHISEDGRQISVDRARAAPNRPTSGSSAETVSAHGGASTVFRPAFDEGDDLLSEFPRVSAEEIFRQTLRRVLDDGIVTDEERVEVRKAQADLGITTEVASRILQEVKLELARRGRPVPATASRPAAAATPPRRAAGQPRRESTKQERTRMYRDFLLQEGYAPTIDKDGDVSFKYEGGTYYVLAQEDDEMFFRLIFPNFWSIESRSERAKVKAAALYTNAQTKVAKIFPVKDDTWAAIEMFCFPPETFRSVFGRSLRALRTAVETFKSKMNDDDDDFLLRPPEE